MAQRLHRDIVLPWIVANYLGVAAIGLITLILPFLMSIRGIWVSSLIIGLPIGSAQWLALRRLAPISILWVLTIFAGQILGHLAGPKIAGLLWGSLDDESVVSLTAFVTTFGLFVGLAQWLFLRGHFSRTPVWPLSSAAGLGLGVGLIFVTDLVDKSGLISIILVVLVYAVLTGWVMAWLARAPGKIEHSLTGGA